jgi:biotin carboxylase
MPESALPKLAFIYSGLNTEDPPLLLAEAAADAVSLVWVLPDATDMPRAVLRMLRGLGEVVDVSGLPLDDAADELRGHEVAGVICCNDDNLVWTAEVAQRLGLRFFSPETAHRLTDKLAQRQALQEGGLPTPAFWDADGLSDAAAIEQVATTAGYPVVLKPRQGHASQDVEAIRSSEALTAALAEIEPGRMLVEGFISDPTRSPSESGSAPYVSVEILASDGTFSVLGVTGRPPLAPPFRETGVIFPADLPPDLRTDVVASAIAAARALGVETGPLHIEVKFTDAGPVIIEVNGVMGGGAIRDLMQRALGLDVVQLTMRIAAGEHIVFDEPAHPTDVGFLFEIQPDADAHRIVAVDGLDSVADIPGVERVIPGLRAGEEFSWRAGTPGFIAGIFGTAPDHATANRIREEFNQRVVVTATN